MTYILTHKELMSIYIYKDLPIADIEHYALYTISHIDDFVESKNL